MISVLNRGGTTRQKMAMLLRMGSRNLIYEERFYL
jgi:hypothetical protein